MPQSKSTIAADILFALDATENGVRPARGSRRAICHSRAIVRTRSAVRAFLFHASIGWLERNAEGDSRRLLDDYRKLVIAQAVPTRVGNDPRRAHRDQSEWTKGRARSCRRVIRDWRAGGEDVKQREKRRAPLRGVGPPEERAVASLALARAPRVAHLRVGACACPGCEEAS